jgi:hypothetical protein
MQAQTLMCPCVTTLWFSLMLMQSLVVNIKMKNREKCNCNRRATGCLEDSGESWRASVLVRRRQRLREQQLHYISLERNDPRFD